jgi:hypothetical protein
LVLGTILTLLGLSVPSIVEAHLNALSIVFSVVQITGSTSCRVNKAGRIGAIICGIYGAFNTSVDNIDE